MAAVWRALASRDGVADPALRAGGEWASGPWVRRSTGPSGAALPPRTRSDVGGGCDDAGYLPDSEQPFIPSSSGGGSSPTDTRSDPSIRASLQTRPAAMLASGEDTLVGLAEAV